MNCEEFWKRMPEPEDGLAPEEEGHLRECSGCAAELAGRKALIAGLHGLSADLSRIKAPARIESKLLAAFRGEAGLAALPSQRPRWMQYAMWSAATAVVAAATLLFVVHEFRLRPAAEPAGSGSTAVMDWASTLQGADGLPAAQGDFIPLPNAPQIAPTDDVNLVRVEVPRSAMIAMGVAVSPDRAAERVRADIVLGSDGLARAVRFVEE